MQRKQRRHRNFKDTETRIISSSPTITLNVNELNTQTTEIIAWRGGSNL
jgi:hypothetical protein